MCKFEPALFHPNVYDDGKICLSIINEGQGWKPSITVKQILIGVQDLLDSPNIKSPAQSLAFELYVKHRKKYDEKILAIAKNSKPKE
jgi:ubiquitin-conjugating enzyme E2 I